MSSYEVVRRAIEFKGPDRLPVDFPIFGRTDVHWVKWNYVSPLFGYVGELTDEWGCVWTRSEVANIGQVKAHPLADWSALSTYKWPDPDDPAFYDGMDEKVAAGEAAGRYIHTSIFMLLFERMQALRGFENALADLYIERERMEFLADRIVEFDIAVIRNISRRFGRRIHGINSTDDWGSERALLVSPALWHAFFKPRYGKIWEAAHEAGWHTWLHSCGRINEALGGMIEAGLDVVNPQQPRVLGIEEVGREFRGRITFRTLCDIQRTLPLGGEKEIREEARLLLKAWAAPEGGFILSDYNDAQAVGVTPEKTRIMFDEFMANDPYRKK